MPRICEHSAREARTRGPGAVLRSSRGWGAARLVAITLATGLGGLGCTGMDDMSGEATATAGETGETAASKGGSTTEGESTTAGDSASEGESSTGGESGAEGESSTGEPIPEACSCYGDCGPSLCPSVTAKCDIDCELPPSAEADLQCALEALRDRTPGRIGWSGDYPGIGDWSTAVAILSDGTARRDSTMDGGLCVQSGPVTHDTLKEPAYFEGCLAEPDLQERFACARAAFADTLAVCEAAYCQPGSPMSRAPSDLERAEGGGIRTVAERGREIGGVIFAALRGREGAR